MTERLSGAYSTREAEARFPEIVQKVRSGETVIIDDPGQPTVEIRVAQPDSEMVEGRLAVLDREGTLVRTTIRNRSRKIGKPIPGALDRFLADRDE